MAFSAWNLTTARSDLATTNATLTTLLSLVMPAAGNMTGQIFVVARDSSGNSKSWNVNVGGKSVGGVASVLGTLVSLLSVGDVAALTWAISIAASGGNLLVQVSGAAATNIDWSAYATTYQAS